jgi:hypothetical protein
MNIVGAVAQQVEQRSEKPRVGGSIPSSTTSSLTSLNDNFRQDYSRVDLGTG